MVNPELIAQAAKILREGGVVAFPTETVYGLGANALDVAAVRRIYEIKGRPATSPLIVHVSSVEMARTVVAEWPRNAALLAREFWPGPLTLVLPKRAIVPDEITAGLGTVGVRIPAHPVALALIEAAGVPIAAPSANRFMGLSPTTADHVRRGLGNAADLILDGGATSVGIESTVLSLAAGIPLLLRPGMVSRSQIEAVIGTVEIALPASGAHASPGMHERHYAPRTPLYLVCSPQELPREGKGIYLHRGSGGEGMANLAMPEDAAHYAEDLYACLHECDRGAYDWIGVEIPGAGGEWSGVLDRLRRAAKPNT